MAPEVRRLLEFGEAVKGISGELTAAETEIPWSDIDRRLVPLAEAVDRLRARLTTEV